MNAPTPADSLLLCYCSLPTDLIWIVPSPTVNERVAPPVAGADPQRARRNTVSLSWFEIRISILDFTGAQHLSVDVGTKARE